MKRTVLFAILLLTASGFSQKLLNSVSSTYFDEFSNVDFADSTVYNSMSPTHGFFNEFKPKFGYDGDIMYFFLEENLVHCGSSDRYNYQGSYPLTFVSTDSNTLTNGLVTESITAGGSFRYLYAYDNQDRKIMEVTQFFNGLDWSSNDSSLFKYDAFGNLAVLERYDVGSGTPAIEEIDSMFYDSGSSRLVESTNYAFDGLNIVPGYQTLISWTGNNVTQLDLSDANGTGGLDPIFRLQYSYTGNLVDGFEAFEFVNGMPDTTPFGLGYFTHNVQNDPESYTFIADGTVEEKVEYTYDAEGFLIKMEYFAEDANGTPYLSQVNNYNFTNIASVNEVLPLDAVIYPNPTVDMLRIRTSEFLTQVQVIDMNGRIILTQKNATEIDVSHLSKGTYIVYGQSADRQFKQTFVKQ